MGKKRFAGSVLGDGRTEAARYGRAVTSHTRGWNIGIEINAFYDAEDRDCFEIWLTGGSNDDGRKALIGTLVEGVGFNYILKAALKDLEPILGGDSAA